MKFCHLQQHGYYINYTELNTEKKTIIHALPSEGCWPRERWLIG